MLQFLNVFRKRIKFADGSYIEWCDKETLKYHEDGRYCLVWVDFFENRFFGGGRLIHSESIKNWIISGSDKEIAVSETERIEIVKKAKQYYEIRKIAYRVS